MATIISTKTSGVGGLEVTGDASGVLQLASNNGTTAVTVDASQNVGIGTSSPSTKLHCSASGVFDLRIQNTAQTNQYMDVGTQTSLNAHYLYGYGSYPMLFATNATERMRIDSVGYVTNAVNGLGNGLVQAQQYYRLNSAVTGANATGAQRLFGVGVTLVSSTVYEFEIVAILSKSAGTTAHTISFNFGGTATVNNCLYSLTAQGTNNNPLGFPIAGYVTGQISATTASIFTTTITAAAENPILIIKGTVSVNAGGTFIPQYTLSAAPGGAYTTQIGSYIKISALGASGANTSVGTWG